MLETECAPFNMTEWVTTFIKDSQSHQNLIVFQRPLCMSDPY